MVRGKAEDAGGLTPAKDDNAAPHHFDPRTLPIFKCVDYKGLRRKNRSLLTFRQFLLILVKTAHEKEETPCRAC